MYAQQDYDALQRTLGWFRSRLGAITGSRVGELMKQGRNTEFSATALSYLNQLAGERLLSPSVVDDDEMLWFYIEQNNPSSRAMRFGTEQEPMARELYEQLTGYRAEETGSVRHPSIDYFASSPDGLVDVDGVKGCIEIKCPMAATATMYAAEITDGETLKVVKPEYYWQCQAHMAVTGSQICHFITYNPFSRYPLHIVSIDRNDDDIAQMLRRVQIANAEIEKITTTIQSFNDQDLKCRLRRTADAAAGGAGYGADDNGDNKATKRKAKVTSCSEKN